MWGKISLRIKITIVTILCLSLITIGITFFSNFNVIRTFINPLEDFTTEYNTFFTTVIASEMEPIVFDGAGIRFEHTDNTAVSMTFVVAESQDAFQLNSIIIATAFILIGAVLAFIISGQTLKPIKTLAQKIEDIDANNLSAQIEPPKTKDELSRLTNSFNNMLSKLNRTFESQRLFAQNAAHELKTPLASIMTNIDVLQLDDEPSAEEYKEVVGVVKDSTLRLIELVEGLLSINNTVDETRWQTFDVADVIRQITADLDGEIQLKQIKVDLFGKCKLKGDKALLERAFHNLVHNAVRYNVHGGSIKIHLEENAISIEDSGIGIAKENLERIFEPFYCVDNSRSKKLGGHGLGMTIAKNIFDMHDIKISVYSELGTGTKIILKTK